jgi:hypothetical protein
MLLSTSNLIPGFLESAIRIWATDTANCRLSGNRASIYMIRSIFRFALVDRWVAEPTIKAIRSHDSQA